MKKNLQNALLLAMGLMTTVTFAQDWNVDSRTRIDMSGDEGYQMTGQRATLGATWGGSDWGIHLSSDLNYTLSNQAATGELTMNVYEAYASTDLMGYATVTAGRQALNYGSGALVSSNDWATNRTTWDGFKFDLGLTDMATITVGYASANTGYSAAIAAVPGTDAVAADTSTVWGLNTETGVIESTEVITPGTAAVPGTDAVAAAATDNVGNMYINASGEFNGWNVNMLYMTRTASDDAATGIDISGEVMGAGISASMNSDWEGDDMRVIGLSYAVNDDMGVNVSQTVYSEADAVNGLDGFSMAGTNMSGGYANSGQMAYLNAGDEMLSYGLTYNISGINLGYTMHNVTNETTGVSADRDVTEISLGYSLNDNAGLGLSMVNDADTKYMWLTLNVGL